jgi:hypothetical protein
MPVVLEFNEALVLDTIDLCVCDRKITRSLRSSSGLKMISTMSPLCLDVRVVILGTDARRAVGSMATLPSAAIEPDLKVNDEM